MVPRRIAYVLKIFPKLSEVFIASELGELRRRGVELQIFSLLPPREELRHELIAGAGLDRLAYYEPARFAELAGRFRPQLLHAHFATEATAVARELAAGLGVPFTFTAHGYDIHRKPPPDFAARAGAARAVVTVSRANADYITRTFGVPESRLRVIPCGIDIDQFSPARGRPRGSEPLIVCVARMVAVKNLGILLQACARLRDRKIGFRCVVIGEGPCRKELEALRAQLSLENAVEMPGAAPQGEVARWWQQADVGVLTSDNEGMPVSLMEAAACAVPVVATAVGGVTELVEQGVTGLLAPRGDAAAVADALVTLLRDAGLRARMSVAARQRAQERFSSTRQADLLLSLWSDLLEEKA
jgi:glycosyltransferase involved in cell wall biosynthesis